MRLQVNGVELRDPALLEIIETRTGAPLAMIEVRESMAHLFGLGLYQDVQVDASLRGDGVVLTYNLVPAQRVRRIVFEGSTGVSENELRRIVVERHGASPSLARAIRPLRRSRRSTAIAAIPRAEIAVRADDGARSRERVDGLRDPARARARASARSMFRDRRASRCRSC